MKYAVAVRTLCEFTAKQGDLDVRFTPSPTALEGMAGHVAVTSRRAAGYQAEITLAGEFEQLAVRGRADGYDPRQNQVEEIKTFRGDLNSMPANQRHLHWAQVRIYGHLLCQKLGLSEIKLALVYFDLASKRETVLSESVRADSLKQNFEDQCKLFLTWAEQELAHRAGRDRALGALQFPHAAFRTGQRPLAEAVYRAARAGRCLAVQAPTGVGKTMGAVFPILKAMPTQALDKVFFLTAKTSGRAVALNALTHIINSAPEMPLRILELIARDKACEYPDKACHGESCPLAKGFYDRLSGARRATLALGRMDRLALRQVALEHQVCPYYLSQDLVRWCDVVVCDYNYYFDLNAMLYGMTVVNQWRVAVLVDEAHNLLERARKMYSAELDQERFKSVRRNVAPELKKSFDSVNRSWNELQKNQTASYQSYDGVPTKFTGALQRVTGCINDYLAENPAQTDSRLQRFYFDALHFLHMADLFGNHSVFDITLTSTRNLAARASSIISLRNIIPASFLAPRFVLTHSTILFSATLTPWRFYSDTLGLPTDAAWLDVEPPFKTDQLAVQVVSAISTRYRDRSQSLSPITDVMGRQFFKEPGNYLAFASSFDYLRQLADLFETRYPHIPIWRQSRGMDETQRTTFLNRFTETGQGIGFAVLGGAFAEGVDLPGRRLIGAFIATLGLPEISPANQRFMQRMDSAFGGGYEYTYLYPGIRKVVQAAGRVIRGETDRGVVYLMDDRFGRRDVQRLLPKWWHVCAFPAGGHDTCSPLTTTR